MAYGTDKNGGSGNGQSVILHLDDALKKVNITSDDNSVKVVETDSETERKIDLSRNVVLSSSDSSVVISEPDTKTVGKQEFDLKAVPTFEVHSNGATSQIVNDEAQPGYYELLSIQMPKVTRYEDADRYTAFLMIDGTGATHETERDFSIINIHFAVHWNGSKSIVDQTVLCKFGSVANLSNLYYVETSDTNNHYITIYSHLPYKSNAIRVFILNDGYISYDKSMVRTWYDSRRPTYQVGKTDAGVNAFYTQNTDGTNKVYYPYTVSNGDIYLKNMDGTDYITLHKESSLHTLMAGKNVSIDDNSINVDLSAIQTLSETVNTLQNTVNNLGNIINTSTGKLIWGDLFTAGEGITLATDESGKCKISANAQNLEMGNGLTKVSAGDGTLKVKLSANVSQIVAGNGIGVSGPDANGAVTINNTK